MFTDESRKLVVKVSGQLANRAIRLQKSAEGGASPEHLLGIAREQEEISRVLRESIEASIGADALLTIVASRRGDGG